MTRKPAQQGSAQVQELTRQTSSPPACAGPSPCDSDARRLRSCLGRFATGVTVVTYRANGEPRGTTVNAFTSISLDPALVLVSIGRSARACEFLRDEPFCVNVLSAHQVATALTFSGRADGAAPEWESGPGAPRLRQSHAWLACSPWRSYDAGDHVIFLGEIQDFAFGEAEPLLFYAGAFHGCGTALDDVAHAPGYGRTAQHSPSLVNAGPVG